jgi:hypothetical protein
MTQGPGKYDEACTEARMRTQAAGVVLIVFRGARGSGFSVQAVPELLLDLPQILRAMADGIERDNAESDA